MIPSLPARKHNYNNHSRCCPYPGGIKGRNKTNSQLKGTAHSSPPHNYPIITICAPLNSQRSRLPGVNALPIHCCPSHVHTVFTPHPIIFSGQCLDQLHEHKLLNHLIGTRISEWTKTHPVSLLLPSIISSTWHSTGAGQSDAACSQYVFCSVLYLSSISSHNEVKVEGQIMITHCVVIEVWCWRKFKLYKNIH